MKIVFSGLDTSIDILPGRASTLEIKNHTLFARVCRTFVGAQKSSQFEPFTVWSDDGEELSYASSILVASDPLRLPWDCSELSGKLLPKMEALLMEDEDNRLMFEEYGLLLNGFAERLAYQVEGEYGFAVEWDIKRYLKTFGFGIERGEDLPYIDSLNMFIDFAHDMNLKKVLVFINLRTFLGEDDFDSFLERVFFHKTSVLMIENELSGEIHALEKKVVVDQHFLEY